MSGDIVDFIISKGNLYLLTDEFADYFSEPSHTTYEGNLYTVPLKDANDDWSRLKHLGTPGFFMVIRSSFPAMKKMFDGMAVF